MAPEGLEQAVHPASDAAPPAKLSPRSRGNPTLAASLSVVPGLGQLYNRQPAKALGFLSGTLAAFAAAIALISSGDRLGRVGLGVTFTLLVGLLAVVVFLGLFVLGLFLWASAVLDARTTAALPSGDPGAARVGFFRL